MGSAACASTGRRNAALRAIHNVRDTNKGPLTPTLSPSDGEREKNEKTFVVLYRNRFRTVMAGGV
jgi:hypothetical protein